MADFEDKKEQAKPFTLFNNETGQSFKIPVLSGYYVNNQKKIYNGFANKKAIFEMGNMKDFSINSFEEQIQLFFKIDFQELINRQKKIFDQNIKNRFCKLISSL